MTAPSSALELKLRVIGDAKSGIEAFGALKAGVVASKEAAQAATVKVRELVQAANAGKLKLLADAQKDADAAAAKVAAAKRELEYFKRQAELGGAAGMKLFGQDIDRAKSAVSKASAELDKHNAQIEKIRTTAATALPAYAKDIAAAKKEAGRLKEAAESQAIGLEKARRALTAQGVDVTRLAAEYRRLTAEVDRATKAKERVAALEAKLAAMGYARAQREAIAENVRRDAESTYLANMRAGLAASRNAAGVNDAARARLGVPDHRAIDSEINANRLAYERLRASGTLTMTELAQAKVKLRGRIAELTQETNGWGAAIMDVRLRLGVLAATVAGGVFAGGQVFAEFKDFAQRMAEVNTVTDVTPFRLNAISQAVREMSVRMGRDATQSAAALYDILSSGIDESNGIAVLEQSTRAAVAGVTDTKIAAQVGVGVLNAYRKEIGELPRVYDLLFQTVKDGVVTFPELAQSIGDVLPIAAASSVGLEEVGAAIAEMTKAGIRAPKAVTALTGAITQLSAPGAEAAQVMDDLGIKWNGLTGTLEQIAAKNLGPEVIRALVPDIEGRTAVLSLTQNIGGLRREVEAMRGSAGAMEVAYEKMRATPQQRIDEFNAALGESKLAAGEAVAALLPVVQGLTGAINTFNSLPEPIRVATAGVTGLAAAAVGLAVAYKLLRDPITLIGGKLGWVAGQATAAERTIRALVLALRLLPATVAISIVYTITRKIIDVTDETKKINAETVAIQQRMAARTEAVTREIEQALLDRPRKLREAAEAAHAGRIKAIKDAELAYIKQVLASQVQAYDDANKDLAAARQKRESIEQANRDFLAKLKAGPAKPAGEINTLDVAVDTSAARQAIAAGDFDAAGKSIDAAREKILAMKQAGTQSQVVLEGLAREVAGLATQAGAGQEAAAKARVDAVQRAIDETLARAEWLKHITIGFDSEAAIQSAEALRAAIQEKLARNPLKLGVVVVQQDADKADRRVDALLGIDTHKATGGPITGPGTGTSDSILAALSNGEHVLTAAEVAAAGGHGAIYQLRAALRAGRLPQFARGGMVLRAVESSLPRYAEGGPVFASPRASGGEAPPLATLTIVLPSGRSGTVQATQDSASAFAALVRQEALRVTG